MKRFNYDYQESNIYRNDNNNYYDKSIVNEKMKKEDFAVNYKHFVRSNSSNYSNHNYDNKIFDNKNKFDYYNKENDYYLNNNHEMSFNYQNNYNERNEINLENRIIYLEKKVNELEKIIKSYEEIFKQKMLNNNEFQNRYNLNDINFKLDNLVNQIKSIQNSNNHYSNTIDIYNSNKMKLDNNNDDIDEINKKLEKNIKDLQIISNNVNTFYKSYDMDKVNINKNFDNIAKDITENKDKIVELNSKLLSLLDIFNEQPSEEELFIKNIKEQ